MQPTVEGANLRPSETPDWFVVDWLPIFDRLGLPPLEMPGVRTLPRGRSTLRPWPHEVHRTLLEVIGFERPAIPAVSRDAILRPHQHAAVNFIRSRRGTLLADEMRVGKSASTMYAYEPEYGPMLVVGPVASRRVWHEWAARRFGSCGIDDCAVCAGLLASKILGGNLEDDRASFLALDGKTFRPETIAEHRPYVMFATYAVVPSWRDLAMAFESAKIAQLGMFACDEVHTSGGTNRKSLTYESLKWLNSIAHRVVLLSGTPMPNKPSGLWALLDLAAPVSFGDFWTCARRYFGAVPTAHGWRADGLTNELELKVRLREIMLRRTWHEIAPNLPPITRTVETVPVSDKQRDEIEDLAARLRLAAGNAKTQVGILARLRRLFATVKIDPTVDYALEVLKSGRNIIVWLWHQETAEIVYEKLQRKGVRVFEPITGKVIGHKREAILEMAREVSGPKALVANISTLGTAVSLTWAEHEVFGELDWNPHALQQAEARIMSPERPCSASYMVADCATDEALIAALLSKVENQGKLNLRSGSGDVGDVLARTFKVEARSMSDLADALVANAFGEV